MSEWESLRKRIIISKHLWDADTDADADTATVKLWLGRLSVYECNRATSARKWKDENPIFGWHVTRTDLYYTEAFILLYYL